MTKLPQHLFFNLTVNKKGFKTVLIVQIILTIIFKSSLNKNDDKIISNCAKYSKTASKPHLLIVKNGLQIFFARFGRYILQILK